MAGGIYSSTADLTTFARAIVNSNLLKPFQTRRWLKRHSHTSSLTRLVGAPWDITRSTAVTDDGRVVDLYAKIGGLGLYSSQIVLIPPDYDLGLTVLVAEASSILNPAHRSNDQDKSPRPRRRQDRPSPSRLSPRGPLRVRHALELIRV